jgi:hypothetical protein
MEKKSLPEVGESCLLGNPVGSCRVKKVDGLSGTYVDKMLTFFKYKTIEIFCAGIGTDVECVHVALDHETTKAARTKVVHRAYQVSVVVLFLFVVNSPRGPAPAP